MTFIREQVEIQVMVDSNQDGTTYSELLFPVLSLKVL